jgi:hypothetical protein
MRNIARFLLLLTSFPVFSLLFFSSCAEDVSVGPTGPTVRHAIEFLDSTITLKAVYLSPREEPSVILNAGVSFRILSDSARILSYSMQIGNVATAYVPAQGILTYQSQFAISVQETFSSITPFISKPTVVLAVHLQSFVNAAESTHVVTYLTQRSVEWTGVQEPNVSKLNPRGRVVSAGELLWAKDNSGFYFHTIQNGNSVVSFFDLSDSSVSDVTPVSESFIAYDLSNNGTELLTGPTSASAGRIAILNLATGSSTALVASIPDRSIISARFSSNDSSVVFSTERADSATSGDVCLIRRNGTPPVILAALTGFSSPEILRWLPTSNDKFAFHPDGATLYIYSLADATISNFPFTPPFIPASLLDDGFTVLGVRVERDGTSVTESHIWKYTIADQAVRQLSFVNEVVSDLRLSPDGKMLVFTSRRDGKLGLYLLNAPGVLAKRTD